MAISRPKPGPERYTFAFLMPCFIVFFTVISATIFAANGVLFRAPRNPHAPHKNQKNYRILIIKRSSERYINFLIRNVYFHDFLYYVSKFCMTLFI